MTKREAEPARDAQLQKDWKATLAGIRDGLPTAHVLPPTHRGETTRDRKNREREVLLALCDRQDWLCFWCGLPMTDTDPLDLSYRTLEHVVARSSGMGIVNHLSNLRAACKGCNQLRAQMQSIQKSMASMAQVKAMLAAAQATIRRHKLTMSGRCYWCKFRFHMLEWWKKRKAK